MKKITLILTAFILILSVTSYAQEATPLPKSEDQVEYKGEREDFQKTNRVHRKKAHKRFKRNKRANKQHLHSMRRVARADGVVSTGEKAVIKRERRKMKRKGNRRFKRNEMRRKPHHDKRPDRIDRN